ncbi:gas vesicle accessory protein GvpU [Thalassobacillus devorans]|uniref:gas vesicle accessory protein GvpU n=1 Tax=Thalassobacillus devorans TaxID=279813 RepID=UPI000A1C9B97|nr:gas vesicle accessory protein GvpU [Thalassobacillus devorans]
MSNDDVLSMYVKAANKHDFNLAITLNVNGALVTGTTISAQSYFDKISESFEDGNDVAQSLSDQLRSASETAEKSSSDEAQFIHLKEAQVYCGDSNPTPSKGKFLWRGKLSEVDGFFLGTIAKDK